MRDHSTVLTRRALLTIAAAALAVGTIAPVTSDYDCCAFDYDLNLHALDCPACLALTCDDCQAGPGEECDYGCSSYWR